MKIGYNNNAQWLGSYWVEDQWADGYLQPFFV